jgi:hypothetical protein
MKKIIDCATGEELERELTAEELKQEAKDALIAKAQAEEKAALEAKKQEVFAKLGLTAEEVATLLA